ncbi:RNA demethylase ALKBH9B [Typha latifolia]|uniref:RNA demethylase ALKBH9B n=1 Tax=Typha latifolia TaxID=4733 RepID=UPI003C2E6351
MDDPFVRDYDPSELEIAAEFLTTWLPFLSRDLCDPCAAALRRRILSLRPVSSSPAGDAEPSDRIEPSGWDTDPAPESPKVRMSWADMAQEDELEEAEAEEAGKKKPEEEGEDSGKKKPELSREQRERIRFGNVIRNKDFICLERVHGKIVNILAGLELHTGVFSVVEQKRIVDFVYELQEKGRSGQLGERTYSEPQKWMRGKGRVTIQFGCCYNYAMDKDGNPPGILQNVVADPIPHLFKVIIRRLIRWHVLPTTCIPDSCIVNIYEPGDCIPPHIDSHDFVRPFCTVSFLSECNILFGSNLRIAGAGDFSGQIAISLPVGSVLVLNGNAADVAKHCVPAVPSKRISITFRKMDENKHPMVFKPEPDLQNILPLSYDSGINGAAHRDKGKQHPAQGKRENKSFKGKRSKGRTIAARPEQILQGSQPLLDDLIIPTERLPFRNIDGQPATTSDSVERGKESVERSIESQPKQDREGTQLLENDAQELKERSAKGRQVEEGSHSMEDSRLHSERRVRLEQRNIIVSRNFNEEEDIPLIGSHAYEPARSPRVRVRTLTNGQRRGRVNPSND